MIKFAVATECAGIVFQSAADVGAKQFPAVELFIQDFHQPGKRKASLAPICPGIVG